MSEIRAVYRLFAAEVIEVDGSVAVAVCIDPLTKEKAATVSFENFDEVKKGDYVHAAQFDDGTFGVAGCAVTHPFPSSDDYAAILGKKPHDTNNDVMTVHGLRENILDGFPDNWQVIFEDENGNVKVVKSAVNRGASAVVRLSSQ